MLFLLSPAKSLDYATPVPAAVEALAVAPSSVDRSAELIGLMRQRSASEVATLMGLSRALAELNVTRYAAWSPQFTRANSRPAAFAFDGDVYAGLRAPDLSASDLEWAQQHLLILSGLHGVLRPLDLLQPYRLEMGTRLSNPKGRDLYAYWGDTIAAHLNRLAARDATPVIVNLASVEYFRAADREILKPRVIQCVFEDWKTDRYAVIGFYAKRARGLMARHAIERRISMPERLKQFRAEGYRHAPDASTRDRWVFRRRLA